MLITGFCLLFAGIFITAFETYRYQKLKSYRFDFLFFITFWYVISYCVTPFAIAVGGSTFANSAFPIQYSTTESFLSIIVIGLGYLSILIGYHVNFKFFNRLKKLSFKPLFNKKGRIFIWMLLFLVGILSFFVFVSRYGGILFALENISGIRSAKIERDNLAIIFSRFIHLVLISTCMLFSSWIYHLENKLTRSVKSINFLVLLLASTLNFFLSLFSGGRGNVMLMFIIFYFTICFIKKKLIFKYLVIFIIFASFFVIYGKIILYTLYDPNRLFNLISEKTLSRSLTDSLASLFQNFAHPYLSLGVAFDAISNQIPIRWFMDFPLGIYFYLRVFGIETPATITYFHTNILTGEFISNIPPGLLAVFWYSALLPGVILGCFLYGFIGRALNAFFRSMACSQSFAIPIYIYLGYAYGAFIFTGEMRIFFMQNIAIITILILGSSLFKIYFFKSEKHRHYKFR
jgi:hypothetical protein